MYGNLSKYDKLENELKLKQLQIKSLLSVTQAINENISASGLYSMYRTFLNWDMGVGKMALFALEEEGWKCVTHIAIDYNLETEDIIERMLQYKRTSPVRPEDQDYMVDFDVIIPVYHKESAIAFALIGEIKDEGVDIYDQLQFINTITNIVAVAIENKRLFKKQIEQERLKKSLQLAAEMQRMLIPDIIPQSDVLQFDYYYQPHYNVGGDYLDVLQVDDDKYVMCIADVSGKGVAAALLMANFQALLRSMVDKFRNLELLVQNLNEGVFRITRGEKFISFFIGLIDVKTGLFEYVNAGHNAPLFVSSGGIEWLTAGCPVLGVVDKLNVVKKGVKLLGDECFVFSYTDGISEFKDAEGEFLGNEFIEEFALRNLHLDVIRYNRRFLKELKKLVGEDKFLDDIAFLSCVYDASGKKISFPRGTQAGKLKKGEGGEL
ncbi:MAG: serine/threonine protein phosphatase [Saprospirales bacterium]|nr:MAG: serine/threonine protein phosphatase [Saprospirales bacterium]